MSKVTVVTTTIRIPDFLKDLFKNAVEHGHRDIACLVIGDLKTPPEVKNFCQNLYGEYGFPVEYLDVKTQESILKEYKPFLEMMPLNSGSRKMIGNFIAYLKGCEQIIMIDDDNFITDEDFFGSYSVVDRSVPMRLMDSDSGWYNVYESVVEESSIPFFPRGYPWQERFVSSNISVKEESLPIVVKNGLVLEDPDVDAITRLFWPIRVKSMKPGFEPHFGLYPGTWTSFNNQNTAIGRDIIPVYFTPPSTGRNADIWTSYVICCLASHMKNIVAFGHPLVRQIRNPHNLWNDLDDESLNDRMTDDFVRLLRSVPLSRNTYLGALNELISGGLERLERDKVFSCEGKDMVKYFLKEYQIWADLFLQK